MSPWHGVRFHRLDYGTVLAGVKRHGRGAVHFDLGMRVRLAPRRIRPRQLRGEILRALLRSRPVRA